MEKKKENGKWKMEDGRWETEDRRWKMGTGIKALFYFQAKKMNSTR